MGFTKDEVSYSVVTFWQILSKFGKRGINQICYETFVKPKTDRPSGQWRGIDFLILWKFHSNLWRFVEIWVMERYLLATCRMRMLSINFPFWLFSHKHFVLWTTIDRNCVMFSSGVIRWRKFIHLDGHDWKRHYSWQTKLPIGVSNGWAGYELPK